MMSSYCGYYSAGNVNAGCQPAVPTLLSAARVNVYDTLQCRGTYTYTDNELWNGPQTRNVTVAALSPKGQRVTSSRTVYMSPIAPQPSVNIHMLYDSMQSGMQGCNVDMKGKTR